MEKVAEQSKEMKKEEKSTEMLKASPVSSLGAFDEMDKLFDRWFENLLPGGWLRARRSEFPSFGSLSTSLETRLPNIDIVDRDDEVMVRAEIPGIDKNDLDVSVSDNMVTIKGQSKQEKKEEKGDYYRCEISRGAFSRVVSLPHFVDGKGAKAKFKDGVLELTLPKTEKTKRHSVKVE